MMGFAPWRWRRFGGQNRSADGKACYATGLKYLWPIEIACPFDPTVSALSPALQYRSLSNPWGYRDTVCSNIAVRCFNNRISGLLQYSTV